LGGRWSAVFGIVFILIACFHPQVAGEVSKDYVQYRLQAEYPIADFSYSPPSPTTADTIQFTDLSSDPDGSVVSWFWDFGDGSTSTQQNPTHRYESAGTYTVTLTVTDDDGLTDSASENINVETSSTTIEGITEPGAPVAVTVYSELRRYLVHADEDGRFRLVIDDLKPGTHTVVVIAGDDGDWTLDGPEHGGWRGFAEKSDNKNVEAGGRVVFYLPLEYDPFDLSLSDNSGSLVRGWVRTGSVYTGMTGGEVIENIYEDRSETFDDYPAALEKKEAVGGELEMIPVYAWRWVVRWSTSHSYTYETRELAERARAYLHTHGTGIADSEIVEVPEYEYTVTWTTRVWNPRHRWISGHYVGGYDYRVEWEEKYVIGYGYYRGTRHPIYGYRTRSQTFDKYSDAYWKSRSVGGTITPVWDPRDRWVPGHWEGAWETVRRSETFDSWDEALRKKVETGGEISSRRVDTDYRLEWTVKHSQTFDGYSDAREKADSTGGTVTRERVRTGWKYEVRWKELVAVKRRYWKHYEAAYSPAPWGSKEATVRVIAKNNYSGPVRLSAGGDGVTARLNDRELLLASSAETALRMTPRGSASSRLITVTASDPSGRRAKTATYRLNLSVASRPSRSWKVPYVVVEDASKPEQATLTVRAVEADNPDHVIEDARITVTGPESFTVFGSSTRQVPPGTYHVAFDPKTDSGWEYHGVSNRTVTLAAGESETVVGYYVKPEEPEQAMLTVDTTPVKGEVFVDGISWGIAPQTRELDAGTYTISFGDVPGYTKPSDRTVALAAGETRTVTGTYVAIPPKEPEPATLTVRAVELDNPYRVVEDARITVTGPESFTVTGSATRQVEPGKYTVAFGQVTDSGWKRDHIVKPDGTSTTAGSVSVTLATGESETVTGYYAVNYAILTVEAVDESGNRISARIEVNGEVWTTDGYESRRVTPGKMYSVHAPYLAGSNDEYARIRYECDGESVGNATPVRLSLEPGESRTVKAVYGPAIVIYPYFIRSQRKFIIGGWQDAVISYKEKIEWFGTWLLVFGETHYILENVGYEHYVYLPDDYRLYLRYGDCYHDDIPPAKISEADISALYPIPVWDGEITIVEW